MIRVRAIALSLCIPPAVQAAVVIPESGVQLSSLLPANTQGQFGAHTLARLANGTYVNMSPNYNGNGDYFWSYTGGSPRIYPNNANTGTTSGTIATPNSLYAPPGNGIDSIFRVDATLPSGQIGIQITGSVLHFQVSGPSNVSDGVTAFIFTDVSGYSSPTWSHTFNSNNGSPSVPLDLTVPYAGASNLYFAINDNAGFIADHTSWVNVRLAAVPEPGTASLLAAGFVSSLMGWRRRITKHLA